MTPEFVIMIATQAVKLTFLLSAPMIVVAMVIGLLVSIFQAATQINEATLTFIPKMIGIGVALIIFAPWLLNKAVAFTTELFSNLPFYISN